MFKIKTIGLSTLLLLMLNACTMVGPDYKQPETKVSDQWAGMSHQGDDGVNASKTQDAAWWKSFNDPVLTRLIQQGYKNNLTLQAAGAQVLQATALLAQSVGELYPQQQYVSADFARQTIGKGSTSSSFIPNTFNSASTSIAASWEPDFWGQYRRAINSNDANFLASLAAYDNALVSLTAEIGSSYVAIRTDQAEIAVVEQNIAVQEQSLSLVQDRYNSGQDSLSDVDKSITALQQTAASLPTLKAELQQQKDVMAVLLGTTPDKVDVLLQGEKSTIPIAPASVAVGIPKDVLRQRPDVRQAELQAIAQSEKIGAVKAQLYPAFTLNGSFGYSASNIGSSSISNIFQWSNHTVSVGPSLYIPLFNYGQITNQVREQDALFQQAIFNYQNVVLSAQKEVQDGIVSYVESQKSLKSMTAANDAAVQTTALTLARYDAGEVDYSEVLAAEANQLSVQLSLVGAQGTVSQNVISLYRALGGGWQIRQGHDVLPPSVKQQMAERTDWGSLLEEPDHQAPKNNLEKIEQTDLPSW